jgi:hypothetical protein
MAEIFPYMDDFNDVELDSNGKEDDSLDMNKQVEFSILNKTIGKGLYSETDSLESVENRNEISHEKSMKMIDDLESAFLALDRSSQSVNIPQVIKMDKSIQANIQDEIEKKTFLESSTQTEIGYKENTLMAERIYNIEKKIQNEQGYPKRGNDNQMVKVNLDIEKYTKLLETNRNVLKIIETNIIQLEMKVKDLAKDGTLNEKHLKHHTQEEVLSQIPLRDTCNIQIISDSHGRNLANFVALNSNFKVQSMVKPGAKSINLLDIDTPNNINENFDCTILLLGSNDVACNEAQTLLRRLKKYLVKNFHSDILLCTVPSRYDLSMQSIVNKEIMKTNCKIKNLCKVFKNVRVLDISNLGRKFHTANGHHFNAAGKRYISKRLIEIIRNEVVNKIKIKKDKIQLSWHTQGNFK